LGDDEELERFSVGLEFHFVFVEAELDGRVYRNESLIGGFRLTYGEVGGAGADYILLAKDIDVLLFGFLCAARYRVLGDDRAGLRLGAGW